jgi:hypothetical protein
MCTKGRVILALLLGCLASIASPAAAQGVLDGPLPSLTIAIPAADVEIVREVVTAPPRAIDRASVRRTLARARAEHLRELRAYARAEQFPINDLSPGMLNIVIDAAGHICAAANLMALDGEIDLVRRTAEADNFVRFVNVHDGAVYEWMLSSGFTQEEIDRIQEPYSFIGEEELGPSLDEQQRNERTRVRNVLLRVARELSANGEASLDVATDRLIAYRAAHPA